METMKLYKGYKPLCYIDRLHILVYKKLKLYKFNIENESFRFLCKFEGGFKKKLLSEFRISARILRLEPRTAIKEGNSVFISFTGVVYKLNLDTLELKEIHKFRDNMRSVLSFTKVQKVNSVDKGIYYGEYLSNDLKKEVGIYKYDIKADTFLKVFDFKNGEINHIHQIVEDAYRDRVWVMTGDFDEASAIWYTDDNFKSMKLFLGGKQCYRACNVFVDREGLIYGTDTPLEKNSVRFIKIDENDIAYEEELSYIEGSVIYGTTTPESYIIATSVEGEYYPENLIKTLLTYKRGLGIETWNTSLIAIDKKTKKTKIIKQFKKDIYPMGLCHFGAIQFVDNTFNNNLIVGFGDALTGIDGKMIVLK